jgi:hypothetical protein
LFYGLVVSVIHGVITLALYHASQYRYDPPRTASRFVGCAAAEVQQVLHAPLFLAGLDRVQPWMLRYALFAAESLMYGYCAVLIVWAVRRMIAPSKATESQ